MFYSLLSIIIFIMYCPKVIFCLFQVQKHLDPLEFKHFVSGLQKYRDTKDFMGLCSVLDEIFLPKYNLRYLIQGLSQYISKDHKEDYNDYWERMR